MSFFESNALINNLIPKIVIETIELSDRRSASNFIEEPHIVVGGEGLISNSEGVLRVRVVLSLTEVLDEVMSQIFDGQDFKKYLSVVVQQRLGARDKNKTLSLAQGTKDFSAYSVDSDGNEVIKLIYDVEFENTERDIKDLSILVVPMFNDQAFSEDFGFRLGLDPELRKNFLEEKIIKDSIIVSKKTQDFRISEKIYKSETDTSDVTNILNQEVLKFDRGASTFNVSSACSYVTSLKTSRDYVGNCRFLFGVDYRNFVSDNSLYGKFFEKEIFDGPSTFGNYFKILSLKVLRRRVEAVTSHNRINSPEEGFIVFSDDPKEITVALSGEQEFKKFIAVDDKDGSLREVNLFFQSEDLTDDARFFTGTDKVIKDETNGIYQYGIEMVVEDKSREIFKDYYNKLESAYNALKKYLLVAEITGKSRLLFAIDEPHIVREDERAESLENIRGNYDVYSNKFTEDFADSNIRRYSTHQETAPWVESIAQYLVVLKRFSSITDERAKELSRGLFDLVHPRKANPDSIRFVMDLISTLAREIYSKIDTIGDVVLGDGTRTNPQGVMFKQIELKTWFKDGVFNADTDKVSGFDYLSITGDLEQEAKDRSLGLRIIKSGDYEKRAKAEIHKYFATENEDINITVDGQVISSGDSIESKKYGVLSPSVVRTNNPGTTKILTTVSFYPGSDLAQQIVDMEITTVHKNSSETENTVVSDDGAASDSEAAANNNAQMADILYVAGVTVNDVFSFGNSFPSQEERTNKTTPESKDSTQTYRSEDTESEKIDPSVADETKCALPRGVKDRILVSNPNQTMYTMINQMDMTAMAYGAAAPSTIAMDRPDHKKIISGKGKAEIKANTIENFDLTLQDNIVNVAKRNPYAAAALTKKSWEESKNISTSEILRTLPNQIKSLFLGSTNPERVKTVWAGKSSNMANPMRNYSSPDSSLFRMNYNMLGVIEVFEGFEKTENSNSSIKHEKWSMLAIESFNNSVGKELLCRIKPYQNEILGLTREQRLELGVFNEYFLIKPERKTVVQPPPSFPPTERPELTPALPTIVEETTPQQADAENYGPSPGEFFGNQNEEEEVTTPFEEGLENGTIQSTIGDVEVAGEEEVTTAFEEGIEEGTIQSTIGDVQVQEEEFVPPYAQTAEDAEIVSTLVGLTVEEESALEQRAAELEQQMNSSKRRK